MITKTSKSYWCVCVCVYLPLCEDSLLFGLEGVVDSRWASMRSFSKLSVHVTARFMLLVPAASLPSWSQESFTHESVTQKTMQEHL